MGRRSRKRTAGGAAAASAARPATPAPPPDAEPLVEGGRRKRGEARNEEIRAGLEPLAPGERPTIVTVGAIICGIVALGNLGLYLGGVEVGGEKPAAAGIVLLTVILLACAVGMWLKRYWAVLGFQALVAITVVYASIALTVASNLAAVALCLALIVPGGFLFWKMVRAMARIQMPERRARRA